MPPSKEHIERILQLKPGQYAVGNRDNVDCSPAVLRKISSEARLAFQDDKNLIFSLLILKQGIEIDEPKLYD